MHGLAIQPIEGEPTACGIQVSRDRGGNNITYRLCRWPRTERLFSARSYSQRTPRPAHHQHRDESGASRMPPDRPFSVVRRRVLNEKLPEYRVNFPTTDGAARTSRATTPAKGRLSRLQQRSVYT